MTIESNLIGGFIGNYDKEKGALVGEQSVEGRNLDITGIQNVTADIIKGVYMKEGDVTRLSVQRVSGIKGASPIFTLNGTGTQESKYLIKKVMGSLDRIFFIPNDTTTTAYAQDEIKDSYSSVDGVIERLGQVIAGNIKEGKKLSKEDFLLSLTSNRRRLQKEKNLSELEAYIYIYRILAPYIGISTFVALQKELSRNPTHSELFTASHCGILIDELNRAFNELHISGANHDEFFFIRDAILLGCSNNNITGAIYPFSQ